MVNWTRLAGRHKPELLKFGLAVLIGMALEIILALYPVPGLKVVRQAGDDMADRLMRFATLSGTSSATPLRFAFIDIDDETWTSWGAPLVTPRDRITAILQPLARSSPAMIVLDIDLAFRDDAVSEAVLRMFLESYPAGAPPLILVRALMPGAGSALPVLRKTEYEAASNKANVIWALPSFLRDLDGNVRRWQLAFPVCEAGTPAIIPSVQLAAAWIEAGNKAEDLKTELAPLVPKDCNAPLAVTVQEFKIGGENLPPIAFGASDAASRVIYTIPWQQDAVSLGPQLPEGDFKVVVRKAGTVTRIPDGDEVPGIEGLIAVVGGSFQGSSDWHETPIGSMPGSLVLVNAVDALARHGTPHEPGWLGRTALSLMMITLVSFCVAIFRPSVAAILSLLGIGILMAGSMPLFKSGLVVNLAIPSLGILMADGLFSIAQTFSEIRKAGWRWVFKPVAAPLRRRKEKS